jgi:urease alpha subunit
LTDDEALAMITINPAKQLGIEDKVGSLEVGKQADIVIFDTHPLSSYAVPQMTFVDGVKYFDIKADKDDQRQLVAASEMVEPIFLRANEEAHRCMQDVDAYFEAFQGAFFHEKH